MQPSNTQQVPQEQTFTFVGITKSEADLIGAALGKLPLEQALPIFTKLLSQCNAQNPAMAQQAAAVGAELQQQFTQDLQPAAPQPEPAAPVTPATSTAKKRGPKKPAAAEPAPVATAPVGHEILPPAGGMNDIPAFLQQPAAPGGLPPLPMGMIPQLPA